MSNRSQIVSGNGWRAAKSLVTLYDQMIALCPNRTMTEDDATIGDEAHQQRTSDHNPNAAGVVTALDLQHDPAGGFDSYAFAETLRQHNDERTKYVISNKRIFYGPRSPSHGGNPASQFKWEVYSGEDPHTGHIHISVGDPRYYDKDGPWDLRGFPSLVPPMAVHPMLELNSTGPAVAQVQKTLGISADGQFGPVTQGAVVGFQAGWGLAADGVVGPNTWAKLDELDAKLRAGHEALTADQITKIVTIADQSVIRGYNWKNRGVAPRGYTEGMALAFATAATWLAAGNTAAIQMAQADTNNQTTDALSWYRVQFEVKGMSNNAAGIDTLRHLFVLMFGLGPRESSGNHWEGRDTTATNTTADTAEAGLFQTSWNIRGASPELPKLFNMFWADPHGFLPQFNNGAVASAARLQNFGSGQGVAYQWLAKYCPLFACMSTAIGLRTRRQHWGPINRREAEIVTAADVLLKQVQAVIEGQPPQPEVAVAREAPMPAPSPPPRPAPLPPVPSPLSGITDNLTLEQATAAVRWVLATAGPLIISYGWASNETWAQVTGVVISLIPLVWTLLKKTPSGIIASASNLSQVSQVVTTNQIANVTLRNDPKVVAKG